jgi:hypothetical protein
MTTASMLLRDLAEERGPNARIALRYVLVVP